MDGIVLVNKPLGLTSFDVVARLRKLFSQKSVGHTGTLDPMAEGLLVCAVGKALRVVEYMEDHDKGYIASVSFGSSTDTYDREGQVTATGDPSVVTLERLRAALKMFTGDIYQKPPIFSALKKDGKKLYELARKGENVEISPRLVHIYAISLLSYEDNTAILEISCSKGTYIRSLAYDLGQALSCPAHLSGLARTFCGPFRFEEAHSLEELAEASIDSSLERFVLSADSGLGEMSRADVDHNAMLDLKNGRTVAYNPPEEWSEGQNIRVYSVGQGLVAICLWQEGTRRLRPKKVLI